MMAAATSQKLEMKHEDAMNRFDVVRKQYLAEEAARTAGMTNIYYADLETLSVLRGIYEKKTLILCGD